MNLEQRIAAQVQAWRDVGQPRQADWLERHMAAILKPFAPARAVSQGVV